MAALAAQVFSPNTKTHQAGLDGFLVTPAAHFQAAWSADIA